jgi:hypothetical protein
LFYPFHSYDRDLIDTFFAANHQAIADLTASTGICIDIEQDLIQYSHPHDLLLLRSVNVRTIPNDLMESALKQDRLINRFLADDLDWFDPALRRDIIASSREDGDLRGRQLIIPEMKYDKFRNFHTQAFDGVFVIRPANGEEPFLIYENSSHVGKEDESDNGDPTIPKYHVGDKKLTRHLFETEIVTIDLPWYDDHQDVYDEKRECLVADIICSNEPDCNFPEMTPTQKKQKLARLKDKIPSVYYDLEHLIVRVATNTLNNDYRYSHDLAKMLIRPHDDLSPLDRETIWQLICRLQPLDVWRLYKSDKKLFYRTYLDWPESKKAWAVQLIAKRNAEYIKKMEQES